MLKDITTLFNLGEDQAAAQELILLALEQKDVFGKYMPILYDLVREVGLFPYLNPVDLNFADRFAYEFHRPLNLDSSGIVFHRPQAQVYRELMTGRSVILSAPTSFGKSLIVDAVVASGLYKNLLVIVPSIALIDETRRRLARFRDSYKVITHSFQKRAERNIFVLTQERALDLEGLDKVDFFVLDEFYKLSPGRGVDERCALLNQVLYRLMKNRTQFYMLGPTVRGLAIEAEIELDCLVLQKPYNTVVSRMHRVDSGQDKFAALVELCRGFDEPTIIFCSSPNRAAAIARRLIEDGLGAPGEGLGYAADWIADQFHPDWHFVSALRRGIGIHHGRIPRALAQYVVRSFDGEHIKFLICTSTLIEGVNTKAKNMVVFDNRINMFTFNNIKGRSGRMFEHFVGYVYLFHDPPPEELPFVDIPAITQTLTAPTSLLIQLDEVDLSDQSKDRLRRFEQQNILGYEVLRENVGVGLDEQLKLAQELTQYYRKYYPHLRWMGSPTWDQLLIMCGLIWKHFGGSKLGAGSLASPIQLATLINKLKSRPTISDLIQSQLDFTRDADSAVTQVLDFLRLWATLHFPRLLRAVDRIQRYIFQRLNLTPGDYEAYAFQVEHLYLDPTLIALDEYGIPLQLARKLVPQLNPQGDLDQVLTRLKALVLDEMVLHPFEYEILHDAQAYL